MVTTETEIVPLRPYQQDAKQAILDARARGVRRQLVSLPTGSGKTVLAAHLVRELGMRTVFMVHRDELAKQSRKSLNDINPGASIGIVKAGDNEVHSQIVVASAQTLARQSRLEQLVRAFAGWPTLFISDEAHHDRAESRTRAINALDPDLLVGLTATPERGDGLGLDAVYDEIVYHMDMLALMRIGKLARLVGLRIETDADLDAVHTRMGEFVEGELATAVNTEARNRLIVDSWHRHAAERKRTVAFCVNVAHARALRDAFRATGITSEVVLGETPEDERRDILERFHEGEIQVLTNCMVLTEGYDEPAIDCILMTRPTKSRGLYVQCVGRGARTADHKVDCLVLDFVDNTSKHSLIALPTLAGIEPGPAGDEMVERMAAGEPVGLLEMAEREAAVHERRAVEVDLFGESPLVWTTALEAAGLRFVSAGRSDIGTRWAVVKREGDGYRPYWLVEPPGGQGAVTTRPIFGRAVDLEMALGIADDAVPKTRLTRKDADWRTRPLPPSEAQLRFASQLRIEVPRGATRAQVSELIDTQLFVRAARRAGLMGGR